MKLNQRQRAQQWLRKLKRVLEWAAALAFDQLAFVGVQSRAVTPNRATLVHVELIGDYFLWLPFALLLNRHLQKQGVEVSIVCNRDLTELVSTNFPECNVFGVERKRFRSDWRYRLKQLRKIRQMGQPEVFCLTCPRDLLVTDSIIRALGGRATGFAATALDRPAIDTLCSDRNYSKLVTAQPSVHQSTLYLTFLREIGCPTVEPVNGVAFRQRGDHGR